MELEKKKSSAVHIGWNRIDLYRHGYGKDENQFSRKS